MAVHTYEVQRKFYADPAQTGQNRFYQSGELMEVDETVAESEHFRSFVDRPSPPLVRLEGNPTPTIDATGKHLPGHRGRHVPRHRPKGKPDA